jgi:hypothetical protein
VASGASRVFADIKNGFFFAGRSDSFRVSMDTAAKAVQGRFSGAETHLQHSGYVFSQGSAPAARTGDVFRLPFPDYYLANVALARARDVVVVPEPMAIAGVSKASFGFTLFNKMEERGNDFKCRAGRSVVQRRGA